MKQFLLWTMAAVTLLMAMPVRSQDNRMIEPYLFATIEVEHIMPFICENMAITLNPKACVFEWRDCMQLKMQDEGVSREEHEEVFKIFMGCMPVSIKE